MIFHSALFVNSVFPTATVLVVVKTSSSEFTLLVLSRILSANVSNTYLVLEFWKLINSSFFFAQLFPNLFDPLFFVFSYSFNSMSESCGGGGSAPSSGWGKKDDEDDWKFAHRCAQMAHSMCKPKPRSRSFHR